MTKAVTVRNYQDTDREQCRSLWRELVEWHREIYEDSTIGGESPEDYFDKYLSKFGSDRIWVAVSESKVVGFIGLVVNGNEAELEPLVVSKDYRGKGMGKLLVMAVMAEARRLGVKYLNVLPVARNVQAMRFFRKMGFKNIGHVGLFVDFSGRKWKSSVELHGCEFDF
jgi:GNAT superfamily N-acetyltransferase